MQMQLGRQRRTLPWVLESEVYSFLGLHDFDAVFIASHHLSEQITRFLTELRTIRIPHALRVGTSEHFGSQIQRNSRALTTIIHTNDTILDVPLDARTSQWLASIISNNKHSLRRAQFDTSRRNLNLPDNISQKLRECAHLEESPVFSSSPSLTKLDLSTDAIPSAISTEGLLHALHGTVLSIALADLLDGRAAADRASCSPVRRTVVFRRATCNSHA